MDLYAAGFNAWRQLKFDGPSDVVVNEPDDIKAFRLVLSSAFIEPPCALLSCTFAKTSTGLRHAGFVDETVESTELKEKLLSSTAAIAGNGSVAVYDENDGTGTIRQYVSLNSFAQAGESSRFSETGQVAQLVAYETGFVALTKDGSVWSWGDERYAACLGREITPSSPAERPGIIEELEDLPTGKIVKIAAAGYVVLALTEGHDLYAWGGHPGRPAILEGLSGSPSPVLVEENDILDCAVGDSHIIVLTVDGDVYVIGDNTNGQLGLQVYKSITWTKVPLPAETALSVVGVKAGQRSSFILMKRHVS